MEYIMIFIQRFIPFVFQTNNFFLFLFVICLSPLYANDSMVKLRCDVNTSVFTSDKGKWVHGEMSWDLGVDIVNKTLIKSIKVSEVLGIGEGYFLNDKFKVISVTKKGLVALSDELKSSYVGGPQVQTITLAFNNSQLESNRSVGVTFTSHDQNFNEDNFTVHYVECK